LARAGLSPGSIDGVSGPKTQTALLAFQQKHHLPQTGWVDAATAEKLTVRLPLFVYHRVSPLDMARLRPLGQTWLSKSEQDRMDYETILELVAEKSHASPTFIKRLNPALDWAHITNGTLNVLPNAANPEPSEKAAFLRINLAQRCLQAMDNQTNLLFHFPCSIGQQVYQRPIGELQVAVIVDGPNYTFNPAIFPESPEARRIGRKLILPPGPNNPVGTVWLGLNRPGYGIHGTPKPEQVGSAESHGCFRLTNWNAELLLQLVWLSMPVYILEGE
jgi:lipoprotein-anchoring transpeptidase ErfK/SrfK